MNIGFMSYFNLEAGEGYEHWLSDVTSRLSVHEISILTSNKGPKRWDINDRFSNAQVIKLSFKTALLNQFSQDAANLRGFLRHVDLLYTVFFTYNRMSLVLDCMVAGAQHLNKVPVIAGHHNPYDWFYSDTGLTGRLGMAVGKRIRVHHVLNQDAKLELLRKGVGTVHKVPNGVDTNSFRPKNKKDGFKILFVGTLEQRKGVDLIPPIVWNLRKSTADFELIVVGEGELKSVLRDIKLNGNVKLLGFVDEQYKRDLYSTSHVLIAPSRSETFMLTGLEALASGTPVVSFNIPGPREYLKNGVNGYLATSVDDMANKLLELHKMWRAGSQEYWDMCRNARRSAEPYDWSNIMPRIETMFRETLGEQ